jgi:hypothetical protein
MNKTPLALAGVAWLCLVGLAHAQDDPFEAILSDRSGVTAALNDSAIPFQNPTEDELRQYLEAFCVVNVTSNFTIDDGTGRSSRVGMPTEFGAFKARNGTRVSLKAKFARPKGKREAVLSELEFVPSSPMSMGPLRFNRMTMDSKGILRFKLNLNLMGLDFWPQELAIEKIFRDTKGNLVFRTGGSGLAGAFGPDMRIKPDGTVQRWSKGWWLFGWHNRGWKTVKDPKGKPIKLGDTLPIKHWPPRATDIMDWLPVEGREGTKPIREGLSAMVPFLDSVPITDISTRFVARAGKKRIKLSDGRGTLYLKDHGIDVTSTGRFHGRTFVSDPSRPNRFRVSGRFSGVVREKGLAEAVIKNAHFEAKGTHETRIPWSNLDEVSVVADYTGSTNVTASRVRAEIPGGGSATAKVVTLTGRGGGRVHLKPLSEDPSDRAEVTLNSDNTFVMNAKRLDLAGLAGPGGTSLPSLSLRGVDGKPAIHGEGTLGNTDSGSVIAHGRFDVDAETRASGMASIIDDGLKARTTLRKGTKVTGRVDATVGIRDDLRGAGVHTTADLRIKGTAANTHAEAGTLTADVPVADVEARVALEARFRTTDGAPAMAVRRAAAEATVTVREPGGSVSVSTNDGASFGADLRPGSRFGLETGVMAQPDAGSSFLETKDAKIDAHLVLGATTAEYKTLTTAFAGEAVVDLEAALGFTVDPAGFRPGARPLGDDPITMSLDVTVSVPGGGTLTSSKNGARTATVRLAGTTRITAKTRVTVDPVTGAPTLGALRGVDVRLTANATDLRKILQPLGIGVSVNSRTTVRIRKATVEFTETGARITHRGITIRIAPGRITVRR